MTGRPSRMRFASIAALNLWYLRRWARKECNNTHYGSLAAVCLEPGGYPLGVVPRVKPVALLCNVIIAILPPTLRRDHGCSLLSVVSSGFIVGKAVPSSTCRHGVYGGWEALEIGTDLLSW